MKASASDPSEGESVGPSDDARGQPLSSELLARLTAGDPEAHDQVFSLLYGQLHQHASRLMRGQKSGHTLQATALVSEAYLRLFGDVEAAAESRRLESDPAPDSGPNDSADDSATVPTGGAALLESHAPRAIHGKEHFMAMAAKAMRWVLIDHARTKGRQKRGNGSSPVPLDHVILTYEARDFDLLALDLALTELAESDPLMAQVVELRFFAGLSMEEIAPVVSLPLRSLERKWRFAKAWLYDRME